MEWSFIVSVALFAAVMTGTPGPNNVMLTASGANFGYVKTLPHCLGIGLGLISLILLNGAGLGVVFTNYPVVQTLLKWLGSGYLLYLAWRILSAGINKTGQDDQAEPMTCLEAVLFQYLNPKAWLMSVTAVSSFSLSGEHYWFSLLAISVIFLLIQLQTSSVWIGFGTVIRRWLSTPIAWKRFNSSMAMLTASCVLFIW